MVSNEICPNEGNDAGSASHRQPLIVRLAIDWLSYLGQGQVSDRSSSHPVTILCSTIKASQVALVVKKKKKKTKPNQTKPKQKQKKTPHTNAGDFADVGLIPGSGRSPGGGHCNPLRYSCLENPMDSGAWQATIYRVVRSQTQLKQLSTHAHKGFHILSKLGTTQNSHPGF